MDRLKLLLISDRTDCSADMLEMIKNDIIQVISKYMEIDTEGLEACRRCMQIFLFYA